MIYNQIYDFCKVRNLGSVFENTDVPTPRVEFLLELLEKEGVSYEIDRYKKTFNFLEEQTDVWCYNIILRGNSDKMLVAHHDVANHEIDNANDNSASVINAIALKKMLPNIHVVLLDGEEFGGIGAQRVSEQINKGDFGDISFVLNLELSGKGGKQFFVGDVGEFPSILHEKIKSQFPCPTVSTPFNDSVVFRRNGIDSCVINPLPSTDNIWPLSRAIFEGRQLDMSMLYHCHTPKDTIDTIDPNDMKEFTEEVVFKILE